MNNNDIIIRLRYALHLNNPGIVKLFKLGGVAVTPPQLDAILTKQDADSQRDQVLSDHDLETFLNGLIIDQRGYQTNDKGERLPASFDIQRPEDVNNVVIKKIKIAQSYTSQDLRKLLALAGDQVSNGEISAILRRPTHRNYRPAGDRYLRKLLQGMSSS